MGALYTVPCLLAVMLQSEMEMIRDPERLLPGRIDGHLSGVHAHRAGGIFLCPYRGELGGPGRRHGGVQPEHEQHGKQGRQRGRGRSRGIHGQRGRNAAEKVKTTE